MAYIVSRNRRFYVVAYDGIDPLTGRERRRWHPAGASRADAEAIAATIDAATPPPTDGSSRALTVGRFLTEQWMPRRRPQLRAIDRAPLRVDDRQLHQPAHRRRPAALPARRTHRPALSRPSHRWQPHRWASSRPRPSTTSTSSCAHRSLTPHDAASSPPTSRSPLTHPTPDLAPDVDQKRGPPASSATT